MWRGVGRAVHRPTTGWIGVREVDFLSFSTSARSRAQSSQLLVRAFLHGRRGFGCFSGESAIAWKQIIVEKVGIGRILCLTTAQSNTWLQNLIYAEV